MHIRDIDTFHLEESVWVGTKAVGVSAYDFSFEPIFNCRRPYERPEECELICRIGAFDDYENNFKMFGENGYKLINSIEEHYRASELRIWYPLIEKFTPRSKCYELIPAINEIENDFEYPIFIKGSRQTAKHKKTLSIARNQTDCERILTEYGENPILHWQNLVCREFVELTPIKATITEKISPSFEFRSFWYKGNLVGVGPYWSEFVKYDWTKKQENDAILMAKVVCKLVNVPFLVLDLALTTENKWIVIECNDGQESGYAGINPISFWQKIIEIERGQPS